jgi:hypothetical protein
VKTITITIKGVFVPVHRQVRSSLGIDVDEGIRALLEVLWANGMVTEFSCQGTNGHPAHICFSRVADAVHFMTAPGDLAITVGTRRAWVDFPAQLIPGLTTHWSQSTWTTSEAARSPASIAPSRYPGCSDAISEHAQWRRPSLVPDLSSAR